MPSKIIIPLRMTPAQSLAYLRGFPLPEEWELGDQFGQKDCAAIHGLLDGYSKVANALENLLEYNPLHEIPCDNPQTAWELARRTLAEVEGKQPITKE